MNVKSVWLGGLVATLLGLGVVRGQGPVMLPVDGGGMKPPPFSAGAVGLPPVGTPVASDSAPPRPGLSDWVVGPRPVGCCGPVGGNGPIGSDLYIRNGASFPVGGAIFSKTLDTGWQIDVGARALFFNKDEDAAWTVDLGVTNIFNPGTNNGLVVGLKNVQVSQPSLVPGGPPTLVTVPNVDVTIKNLNRTYVNLAIGREIWLMGNAEMSHDELNWRIGVDLGGRWGTDKVELHGFNHRTATIGGGFIAVHTDLEIPVGSLIFIGGVRGEWGYTWDQVLQTSHNGENEDLNLLFTLGVRF